jgi:two-component system nitrate/nitrite sensor histidine kinase NarQ
LLVPEFVARIDKFVFKLQQDSEDKLLNMVVFSAFGLTCIVLLSFVILRFVRLKVIYPLNALVHASRAVESNNFDVVLNESVNNEIGVVASAFNAMAQNIKHQYDRLETAVEEKTEKLHKANQSLQVLYESTQQLSASRLTTDNFQRIIDNLTKVEHINAVKLSIDDSAGLVTELMAGSPNNSQWIEKSLILDGVILGSLSIQTEDDFSDTEIVENMTYILARGVYYNQAQKKFEQLLIYGERSAIARELHDSLAQSLSFLKIQVSLLKRSLNKEAELDSQSTSVTIVSEIEAGLKEAYTQLRELLSTFRLSINEANFGEALNVLIEKMQTTAKAQIKVDNSLASIQLQASEQIHLLQIVREAINNAIKHANCTEIKVKCCLQDDEILVSICDNGTGFDTQLEKPNHYGLGIMNERSRYLNGTLNIASEPGQGCCVNIVFTSKDERKSE